MCEAVQVPLESLEAAGGVAGVIQTAGGRWLGCQAPGGGRADFFIDLREVHGHCIPESASFMPCSMLSKRLEVSAFFTNPSGADRSATTVSQCLLPLKIHAFACRPLSKRWTWKRPRWVSFRGT